MGGGGVVMERNAGAWTLAHAATTANLRAALVPGDEYGGSIDYVAGEHGTLLGRCRGTTKFGLEDL